MFSEQQKNHEQWIQHHTIPMKSFWDKIGFWRLEHSWEYEHFFSLNFYSKNILNANISFCKQLNNRLQNLRENIDLILQNSTIKGTKVLMEKLTNFWKSEMKEKISKRKTEDETICKTTLFHPKCLVNNKKTMSSEYSTTLSQWKVSETKSAFDDSHKAENMNNFFHWIFTPKISNISFCKQLNYRLQILRENIDLILQNSTIKGTKVLMEKLTNFWKTIHHFVISLFSPLKLVSLKANFFSSTCTMLHG